MSDQKRVRLTMDFHRGEIRGHVTPGNRLIVATFHSIPATGSEYQNPLDMAAGARSCRLKLEAEGYEIVEESRTVAFDAELLRREELDAELTRRWQSQQKERG